MKAALAFAMALSAATAAVPQFAQEWSAFIVSDLVQNQGTFDGPNDSLCCDINAIDCQVQVQSQGGMTYFSLSRNATTQVFGAGQDPYAIVTLFNDNRECRAAWFVKMHAHCRMPRSKRLCGVCVTARACQLFAPFVWIALVDLQASTPWTPTGTARSSAPTAGRR